MSTAGVLQPLPEEKSSAPENEPSDFRPPGDDAQLPVTPHAADPEAVTTALGVDPSIGMRSEALPDRRLRFGDNTLQSVSSRSMWLTLKDQFLNLIVALLASAALIAWMTGDHLEAGAIVVVIVLNATVGFVVERKAGRALEALRRQLRMTARVRRDGWETVVDAQDLVVGDIVVLNSGDRVPADVRVLDAANLRAEEAALTGESTPVEKGAAAVPASAMLAERRSMLHLGTTVSVGRGVGVVTAVGVSTELGRVGRLVAGVETEPTPLERRLDELGRRLVYLMLAIMVVVTTTGWLHGENVWLMVETSISLAVAAIPEALPAVTTLILALGVLRMARSNAVVRRLSAVETLGSTTIICTDKTGTLTENRMTVREYRLSDGTVVTDETENEKRDEQTAFKNSSLVTHHLSLSSHSSLFHSALRASVLCNEAAFHADAENGSAAVGDPTETALLESAYCRGLDVTAERIAYPKIHEDPFDAAVKRMTTEHLTADGMAFRVLKGAPAVVLDMCGCHVAEGDEVRELDADTRARFLDVNAEMAERALRVLALAETRPGSADGDEREFVFLGLVGMMDPPRRGVAEAVETALNAGIRVVMLTGDQINTAQAVARELRIAGDAPPKAIHASELAEADSSRLAELARETDVFARVSPEDKLRIVDALMRTGETVAVTGDGVNDAPALKRASIGIAMGQRGTEVAKEASDMVLADDNFATIVKAVEGGRMIYANIVKFVHLMFSKNLGEVLVIFVAILLGWPLPLLPLQILWLNMVTDVFPAMSLAVEPPEPGRMKRPPVASASGFLSLSFSWLIVWQGVMLAAIVLSAYYVALERHGEGAPARTIALFVVIGSQLAHVFNCRSQTRSAFSDPFRNPYVWGAVILTILLQLAAVHVGPLALALKVVAPAPVDWAYIIVFSLVPIPIVELAKFFGRRRARRR